MRPAAIRRGVRVHVVYPQDFDAARAQAKRGADREQIAGRSVSREPVHERLARMPDKNAQPVTREALDSAQQPERLQRVLAEADSRIEHDAAEIEVRSLPLVEPLLEPALDFHDGVTIDR